MVKVLHLLNTGKYSGAENVAITIINNTKKYCNSIYVSPEGEIRKVLDSYNIEFVPLKKVNYIELKKIVQIFNPDVIHAHDFTTSIIASLFGKKIKVISHLHNNPPWLQRCGIKSILYFLSMKYYREILCVSDSIQREYFFSKFMKRNMKTIGNPMDTDLVLEKSNEFNIEDEYDVIFIGRLCEQKNPESFIKIIKKISRKYKQLKVAILGDGDYRDKIQSLIEVKHLSENVKLYGFVDNPYPYLKKSKILCITSLWEGYGLVAVEALTLNKPVVAPPVGGLINIVNSKCGMLCRSEAEFVDSIIGLLSNEMLYKQKSLATQERLKEILNLDEYMNYIIALYCN